MPLFGGGREGGGLVSMLGAQNLNARKITADPCYGSHPLTNLYTVYFYFCSCSFLLAPLPTTTTTTTTKGIPQDH